MDNLRNINRRIKGIKAELAALGDMRPGSLSRQTRRWGGAYWQLSYTHRGKGHTEYVREEDLERVRQQVADYRRFRELTAEWVDLALECCRLKNSGAGQEGAGSRSGDNACSGATMATGKDPRQG